jgi:tRNA (guanine-N7-)-methyltransferase
MDPNPQISSIYQIKSITDKLNLQDLFVKQQPFEVELGTGDGNFLFQYATAHPNINFIGVERLLGRLRKLDKKAVRYGLQNLRLLRIEALYFLQYLLPDSSIQALHIYFPDPWPKKKHHKKRLINDRFPQIASRVLQPTGYIHIKTDDRSYYDQIMQCFEPHKCFQPVPQPKEIVDALTDFERDFLAVGKPIYRITYQYLI